MPLESITGETCLQALRAVRYDRALTDSPLLSLELVAEILAFEGLSDTPESRQWALTRSLADTVWSELELLRGDAQGPSRDDLPPETEQAMLLEDCLSGSEARQHWGLLYYRYLGSRRVKVSDIAEQLAVTRRTLSRWLTRGQQRLAETLREQEAEALRRKRQRAEREAGDAILTFLFTDIQGSTQLWEAYPKAMHLALERHFGIIAEAVTVCGGQVFKTVGDACYAAFVNAGDALRAAVQAQRALTAESWSRYGSGFGPVEVRMGLHAGEARERGGDYFGTTVNRVARIQAAGHGGQILLSSVVAQLVRESLPEGQSLRDLGEHRLKDLRYSERLYQLTGPRLPEVDAPPVTMARLDPPDRVRVLEPEKGDSPAEGVDAAIPWQRLSEVVTGEDSTSITLTPDQAAALAGHRPADWREWRLGRVAEWSQPRYRLDGRFVELALLIDKGEASAEGRWQATEERYGSLDALLEAIPDPAVVLLGPPGSGKSTLLRRLELELAIEGLRDPAATERRVTCFVSLSAYKAAEPGQPVPSPAKWLASQWQVRNPDLPSLDALLAQGRVTLLLDALNEMPTSSERGFREGVQLWKEWLHQLVIASPGNRVIFACRSLDYSQPLSTPELRVPQVRIEPMTDVQVKEFLVVYSPGRWREIWAELEGRPQLEVLRSPYFLALLVEQIEAAGEMPAGRAALFTGFVRQALRRELERGSRHFESDALLATRDRRQISLWRWQHAYDLPERGLLVPRLSKLANAVQLSSAGGEQSQVRIDLDEALSLLDSDFDEEIVAAGEALSILDEDEAAGELMYIHQLVQEYFAARELVREPKPELLRSEWRAAETSPSLDEVIDALDALEPLPGQAQTGWEETTLLAAAMADDRGRFIQSLAEFNLVLAGRCAAQAELRPRLTQEETDTLRRALVHRSRDSRADLRERIAAGYALGDLGDPRFERKLGPHGSYLLPPTVEIPGGTYVIGMDERITGPLGSYSEHRPRHVVEIAGFGIGRFPLTNAEWRCFVDAGGYEDDRWWDTASGRAWRRGENTAAGMHAYIRRFVENCRTHPEWMDKQLTAGHWDEEMYELFKRRTAMSTAELDESLRKHYPGGRLTEPDFWSDERFNRAAQPVVGICWYEAQAYARWLSEQSGLAFRLPTEVEWEAAARGAAGRAFAYGDVPDRLRANLAETHVRRTTPVGVFPDGDTPEGICDLTGNACEWTSSAFGRARTPEFPYPYRKHDGRELAETGVDQQRVMRGGSWSLLSVYAVSANRLFMPPVVRNPYNGVRLALDPVRQP